MWWKKNKWKVIIPVLAIAILACAFYFGGNAPGSQGWSISGLGAQQSPSDSRPDTAAPVFTSSPTDEPEQDSPPAQTSSPDENTQEPDTEPEETAPVETPSPEPATAPAPEPTAEPAVEITLPPAPDGYEWKNGMMISTDTGKDQYLTDPVPDGMPLPVEPDDAVISSVSYTCTISISCATILNNLDSCDPDKVELVPEDGWILKPMTVTFYEGESVFNVLQRVCKQYKIHLEFENTPMYNSVYIEAINNLYEFDVGDLSGWMYKVNDWFPNYGCSRYSLKNGDVISWVYTCNLGYDVGGGHSVG